MRFLAHIPRYALIGGFTALDMRMRVASGQNVLSAAFTSAAQVALFNFAPGPLSAIFLSQIALAAGPAAMAAYRTRKAHMQSLLRPRLGRGYQDTEQAYTMRQAALQAINRSYLNARFYLGQEASFLHA